MSRSRVVVATRKSALALAQSRAFIARLAALHPSVSFEELLVTTTGDVVQDRALSEIGGKGLFVKEIEEALLDGRADIPARKIELLAHVDRCGAVADAEKEQMHRRRYAFGKVWLVSTK